MNESPDAAAAVGSQLCLACGLCCDGVIFANLELRPGDDMARLRSLGLPVCSSHSTLRPPHLTQPCAAFDGVRCRVYADRPEYCRQFECVLLKSVLAGRTKPAGAMRIIRTARERADKVRRLLKALGDTDEQLPLSARFRRTGKRIKEGELDEETADNYAQLTLAVHDLNLLLSDAFYPGSTVRPSTPGHGRTGSAVVLAGLMLLGGAGGLRADQVELNTGDRYVGRVLSVDTDTVILQSAVLGKVRLPRSKVAVITLGPDPATNSPALRQATNAELPTLSGAATNAALKGPLALKGMSVNSNLIQQVQKQFLSGAGDEANTKFNELLGGLMSGKLNLDDIRAQAKSAADQLRALQKESGEETGFGMSAYLAILDHFLKETAPAGSATNAPATAPSAKPAPTEKEE